MDPLVNIPCKSGRFQAKKRIRQEKNFVTKKKKGGGRGEAVNNIILSLEEQITFYSSGMQGEKYPFIYRREKWEKLPDMKTLLIGENSNQSYIFFD